MTYKSFNVTLADHIAHVQLARPDAMNSMNADFWLELPLCMRELEASGEECSVCIIAGRADLIADLDKEFGKGAVARGQTVFAENCARCHSSIPETEGGPFKSRDFAAPNEAHPRKVRADFLGNDQATVDRVVAAAKATDEPVWQLPVNSTPSSSASWPSATPASRPPLTRLTTPAGTSEVARISPQGSMIWEWPPRCMASSSSPVPFAAAMKISFSIARARSSVFQCMMRAAGQAAGEQIGQRGGRLRVEQPGAVQRPAAGATAAAAKLRLE